jgi:O-antigen/teichoic acid export membrane protein
MLPEGKSQGSVFTLEKSIEGSFLNFSFLGISKGLVHILHLATLAVVTRRLGPDLFGQMSLFLMITQFMYLVTSSWTGVGYTRYAVLESTSRGQVSAVFWSRNLLLFVFISVAGVVIAIERVLLLNYLNLPSSILILIFVYFFSLLVADYARQLAQVATEFKRLAILQLIEKGVLLLFICIWGESILTILTIFSVTALGFGSYFFSSVNSRLYWPLRINLSLCRKLLSFSYPLILTSVGGFIFGWIDIAIIKHFFPFSEVGIYSLAYRGLSTVESIVLLMPMVLTPIFVSLASREKHELTERFLQRVLPQIFILWGFVIILFVLLSPWAIPLVFGEDFRRSASIFLVLLIPLHLSVFYGLSMSIFIGYDMVSRMVLINISSSLINLLLDLVLVPWMGMMGAAVATTISYGVLCISYFALLKGRFRFSHSRLLLFIGIIAAEVVIIVHFDTAFTLVAVTMFTAVIYILATKLWGIFGEEDKSIYTSLEMPVFLKKTFNSICDYCG